MAGVVNGCIQRVFSLATSQKKCYTSSDIDSSLLLVYLSLSCPAILFIPLYKISRVERGIAPCPPKVHTKYVFATLFVYYMTIEGLGIEYREKRRSTHHQIFWTALELEG